MKKAPRESATKYAWCIQLGPKIGKQKGRENTKNSLPHFT